MASPSARLHRPKVTGSTTIGHGHLPAFIVDLAAVLS